MATNFDIPKCANFMDRVCPRSDTYISKETDDAFVIRCRTCSGINVLPKLKDERKGKYEAKLKKQSLNEQVKEQLKRRRVYSDMGEKNVIRKNSNTTESKKSAATIAKSVSRSAPKTSRRAKAK